MVSGLARSIAHRSDHDVVMAGFLGQPLAIGLSMLCHQPIILDAYVSIFDTLCEDRRRFRPNSLAGRLAWWIDQHSCLVAAQVLTDTRANADYFSRTFGVPAEKLTPIYVGCDESLFYPRDHEPSESAPMDVFYYGAFLPLHGTETIIKAAALLHNRSDIQFTIGGDGMRLPTVKQMVHDLALTNVELVGWIPLERLPEYIANATVCLGGHFSTVPKATRVISTKTYQFLAMSKPTIVGDNRATGEFLVHGKHVWAVPMGNAEALAAAIEALVDDPSLRQQIARGGHEIFCERLTVSNIADQLADSVREALCASAW
jgi:glycosyltransferase involved in cell wall biosynthesis